MSLTESKVDEIEVNEKKRSEKGCSRSKSRRPRYKESGKEWGLSEKGDKG